MKHCPGALHTNGLIFCSLPPTWSQQPAHNFLATSLPLNHTVSICCTQRKYAPSVLFPWCVRTAWSSSVYMHVIAKVPRCSGSPNGFTCPFPQRRKDTLWQTAAMNLVESTFSTVALDCLWFESSANRGQV